MSFEAAAKAIKSTPKTGTEKLLLILLADCHNAETGQCNPSLNYLKTNALVSRSTVAAALKSREGQGYLTRITGGTNSQGRNFSTQYILKLEGVVQPQDYPPKNENEPSESHANKGLEDAADGKEGGSPITGLPSPTTGLGCTDERTRVVRQLDGGSPTVGPKPVINQEENQEENQEGNQDDNEGDLKHDHKPIRRWTRNELFRWAPDDASVKFHRHIKINPKALQAYRVHLVDLFDREYIGNAKIMTGFWTAVNKFNLENPHLKLERPPQKPSPDVLDREMSVFEIMAKATNGVKLK